MDARDDIEKNEFDEDQPQEEEISSSKESTASHSEKPRIEREHRADDDEAMPLIEESTERAWYVVHCYSGYENKVRYNLEQRIETMGMKDRIFDVVIPTRKRSKSKTASAAR